MLIGCIFGFLVVVMIGAASADETDSQSSPALPVESVSAVVVAAGADSLDTNALGRLSAETPTGIERGTAFQLDDGRVASVAHVLLDARAARADDQVVDLESVTITRQHDLASIAGDVWDHALTASDVPVDVGTGVVMGGIPRDGRIAVVPATVIARTSGVDYGIGRPDVYVLSATADLGWSGGPVVNADGDVVAIIVGVETRTGVTLAVPIEYLP